MSVIIDVLRSRGSGLARQSDRGSGGHARGRGVRPRCRAVGRFHRSASKPSSCATATRTATWARARMDAVIHVNEEIAEALVGARSRRPARHRRHHDRARRHRQQGQPRARTPSWARRWPCAKAAAESRRAAAVQVRGRRERPRASHAHDEHPERRRACRQQRGLPGVHDHAGRRSRPSPRRCAGAPRSTTRSRRSCTTPAWAAAWATRAASLPTSTPTKSRFEYIVKACEAAGYKPGTDIMFAMDPASTEFYDADNAEVRAGGRRPRAHERRNGGLLGSAWSTSTPSSRIEDGMAEEDWDGWKELTDAHRRPRAAGGRRPVRHQLQAPGQGHRDWAARTPSSSR